jgi:hypothetical protein
VELSSLESVLIALALVLPGFVFIAIREGMVPSPRRDFSKSFWEFFGYGATNFMLFAWYLVPRVQQWGEGDVKNADYFAAPLIAVVVPAIASVAWIRASRSGLLERLAGMGDSRRTPEPAAWDFFFGRRRNSCWVLVRMKDGENIGGIYESGCYASRYPENKTLFLTRVAKLGQDGEIIGLVKGSAGVLIDGAEIAYTEFWEIN